MKQDIVKDLGLQALGTRLKRAGERVQAQTQAWLESQHIRTPASHFPLLMTLDQSGAMGVGDIAEALGISQPGVTRQIGVLQAEGLVETRAAPHDLRCRTVELSKAGRQLIARARRTMWPGIEAAVADACGPEGPALLRLLSVLEEALAAESLGDRATRLQQPGHTE
ncbi:MarR family transcriptional regulator [Ideonella sp. DXS29W]|uniref:MarR family transcriptional regulator n=1 Tax=Ideonella lacteola TaxID=2984193 RepID=A0ABU9BKS9_9BURK